MKVIVKKCHGAAVRLPAAVMKAANLSIDQEVEIEERDGEIMIRPVARSRLAPEEVIAATPDLERQQGCLDENVDRRRKADDAFEQMVARMQTLESKALAKSLMTISSKDLRESLNKAPTTRSNG